MIKIDFYRFVLVGGCWILNWGTIIAVLAAMIALLLLVIEARCSGLSKKHIAWLCLLIPVSGYIGGLMFSNMEELLFEHTTRLSARMDGVIIGAIVILLIYCSISKLPFWQLADIGVLCFYPFILLYRIGCVLEGCCYGIPCDLPWAIVYTNPSTVAPLGTATHPTQLYHLIWTAIIVATIWTLRKRFKTSGLLALLALILYSVGDFIIRFFRANEPTTLGLSLSQLTALLQIAIAVSLFIYRLKTAGQKKRLTTVDLPPQ